MNATPLNASSMNLTTMSSVLMSSPIKLDWNELSLTTEQIHKRISMRQANAKRAVLEHDKTEKVNWAAYAHLIYLRKQNSDIDSNDKIIWGKWTRSCKQREQDFQQLKEALMEFIQNSGSLTDEDQMAAKEEVLAADEINKVDWMEFLGMINSNDVDTLQEIIEIMIQ